MTRNDLDFWPQQSLGKDIPDHELVQLLKLRQSVIVFHQNWTWICSVFMSIYLYKPPQKNLIRALTVQMASSLCVSFRQQCQQSQG